MSTIALDPDAKKSLKEFKITENESYNSIIKRLIVEVKEKKVPLQKILSNDTIE